MCPKNGACTCCSLPLWVFILIVFPRFFLSGNVYECSMLKLVLHMVG